VIDPVDPYGSIMAGDWEKDMPWRKGRGRSEAG
jgi:tRNA-splicing ligase RtcB (3'-phosphate/5'-hydroxy nucleic acid ligase)